VLLKMRFPHAENDGAFGYVDACAVKGLTTPPENGAASGCLVHLESGAVVPSLFSKANTEKRLSIGRQVLKHYCSIKGGRFYNGSPSGKVEDLNLTEALLEILDACSKTALEVVQEKYSSYSK